MRRQLLNHVPFAMAASIFLVGLTAEIRMSYEANATHFVYTLDDPYIHMALAKNIALHGVFGLTRFEFSSSTSSPLWTLLIAASYNLVGVHDWVPGMWALLFALAALYATDSLCRLFGLKALQRFITCCAVLYFTPLIPLVSTGMEHAMHLFWILLLVVLTVRFVEVSSRTAVILMCTVGLLSTATRYESLFLVAPIAFCLLVKRHWLGATALVISSLFPVIAYGIFSISHGSYFLPNSLMLKGHFYKIAGWKSLLTLLLGFHGFTAITRTNHLYSTSILLLLGAFRVRKHNESLFLIVPCLMCSILLHLQFASTGWFYRYEGYLVGVSMALLGCLYLGPEGIPMRRLLRDHRLCAGLPLMACSLLLLWPLHRRAKDSLDEIVSASHHIYRQQYQMGQFLKNMYGTGVRVAVNDVGAVTYYADIDVLDLGGIGSIDVARAKRGRTYDSQEILRLMHARKTDVVMVYTNWFEGKLPTSLVAVCSWSVTNPYFGQTVTFFGTSDASASVLQERLRRYQSSLPDSVDVTCKITEP